MEYKSFPRDGGLISCPTPSELRNPDKKKFSWMVELELQSTDFGHAAYFKSNKWHLPSHRGMESLFSQSHKAKVNNSGHLVIEVPTVDNTQNFHLRIPERSSILSKLLELPSHIRVEPSELGLVPSLVEIYGDPLQD